MKLGVRVAQTLDFFLAPELRKLEWQAMIRARFLVFALLFMLPWGFVPSLMMRSDALGMVYFYQGLANFVVVTALLGSLMRSRSLKRVAILSLVWFHILFGFHLIVLPSLFSLIYLWSSSLVVFSSLMFGLRGALFSSLVLTTASILHILYQYAQGTVWMSLSFEQYIEQILLGLTGSMLLTAVSTGLHEYMREVSQLQEARQRLIAARHAHSGGVGELVGHVAHEVNNPLAILQGSVMRLKRQLETNTWNHDAHKLLGHMLRSYERIIRVQQSLSIFATGHQHEPFVSHDMRTLLRDVQLAMKPQAQAQKVQLDFIPAHGSLPLRCQPHQLVLVLCSLIQNSLDALRDHPSPHIVVSVKEDRSSLALSVADNGHGIEASAQEKIFQPFFTTRPGGQARGLSLSVSRGIVSRHGGEISFTSGPGGTIFTCRVPREAHLDLPRARGA